MNYITPVISIKIFVFSIQNTRGFTTREAFLHNNYVVTLKLKLNTMNINLSIVTWMLNKYHKLRF